MDKSRKIINFLKLSKENLENDDPIVKHKVINTFVKAITIYAEKIDVAFSITSDFVKSWYRESEPNHSRHILKDNPCAFKFSLSKQIN